MNHSTHYHIVSSWIDSCTTELQMDAVNDFINNRLLTDEKTMDDLISYWNKRNIHRSWVAAKVANNSFIRLDEAQTRKGDLERFPATDEHFSDNCEH